jgi:hypothetical protein
VASRALATGGGERKTNELSTADAILGAILIASAVCFPKSLQSWGVFGVNSWCWTLFVLYVGKRFLDFTNRWLQYGQEMIMPFFLFHQPVIIVSAFYVVQSDVSLLLKLLIVVLSSFVVTLGLYELFIQRISAVRVLFGMKPRRRETP